MRKTDINYRVPKENCGCCTNSFSNSYDDVCCKLLATWDTVDKYGVCDAYRRDNSMIYKGTCANCKQSYWDVDKTARCRIKSGIIHADNSCSVWELGV